MELNEALKRLGIADANESVWLGSKGTAGAGAPIISKSPIDGRELGQVRGASAAQTQTAIASAQQAFVAFKAIPAPVRGEFVRRLGDLLREEKEALGTLVTWEVGKILQEGLGEVQEMIDICDFATGLSRQLYGKTIASERAHHRLTEQWHPLGPIGVISAFNFPVAVWAWNAAIAWVCGDPVVWKPSEKAPLCALACHQLTLRALKQCPEIPEGVANLVLGEIEAGTTIAESPRLPLVSATGSVRMGKQVGAVVGARLGRALLELGGNNAAVVAPSADPELTLRGVVFSAVGTAGQRCTSLRRLMLHESIYDVTLERIRNAYKTLRIGDPMAPETLLGPLIDEQAWQQMSAALERAKAAGGKVHGGRRLSQNVPDGGVYVEPALVELTHDNEVVHEETFAPILYVLKYSNLEQAIAWNNEVTQGLSSAIFTSDAREAERFCSAIGSDCGIANVNIGTSGAEIGGAFGGEKDTGGGRESGSDSWKAYMRRATNTVNYSDELPLAQGIRFEL